MLVALETKTVNYPLHKGNVLQLVSLTKETSHRMPSGLTREERKLWAKGIKGKG